MMVAVKKGYGFGQTRPAKLTAVEFVSTVLQRFQAKLDL
jgi:hypothetical protein